MSVSKMIMYRPIILEIINLDYSHAAANLANGSPFWQQMQAVFNSTQLNFIITYLQPGS